MGDLSANFSEREFRCPCCDASKINMGFIDKLQFAREQIGKSMTITSGYRCFSHNRTVGGSDNSSHVIGLAADISCTNSSDRMLFLSIFPEFFNRIGVTSKFIHVDIDDAKAPDVLWLYPPKK